LQIFGSVSEKNRSIHGAMLFMFTTMLLGNYYATYNVSD